jgi:hypothetical protein
VVPKRIISIVILESETPYEYGRDTGALSRVIGGI